MRCDGQFVGFNGVLLGVTVCLVGCDGVSCGVCLLDYTPTVTSHNNPLLTDFMGIYMTDCDCPAS